MRIEILESAREDLDLGRSFYEQQKPGLGDSFLDSIISDIESLRLFAGVHALHFERYHRLLSKRFPFAVYYRVEGEIVRIFAILDCRQNPDTGAQRLK
ncbi:MAG TPA: type II toxin-antitoxin system RelE/ParE family toxin [Planctomycetota bacterium]|nr:type II toxin-antitoxin system RelE/ParE family toxin [Planctomycetota bacterium]